MVMSLVAIFIIVKINNSQVHTNRLKKRANFKKELIVSIELSTFRRCQVLLAVIIAVRTNKMRIVVTTLRSENNLSQS